MSERLRKYAPLLRKLKNSIVKDRKKILCRACTPEFIACICECALNILKGNVKLKKGQMQNLRRRSNTLRELVSKKVSTAKKRKIIQKGGFLGALLGPIVSILGGLFGR
jgi:hypothetical protein